MKAIEAIRLLTEERDNVNPHLYGGEELVRAYELALECLQARKFGEDLAELYGPQLTELISPCLLNLQPNGVEINHNTKETNP